MFKVNINVKFGVNVDVNVDAGVSGGRKVFREFLRSEYSEENMLFWQACEDLKQEQNPELVEEKARLIYEDYISILSPKEVCGSGNDNIII